MGREPSAAVATAGVQGGGHLVRQPQPVWTERGKKGEGVREGEREAEGEAGTAGEGGLPTSDPADGGHMAAASQIKRLRLGGSAITAV